MAELFLLRAEPGGHQVVLKQLLPNASEQVQKLFVREAEALASLESPYVVQYVGQGPGQLLVEYVDGCDLATLMEHLRRRGQRLPTEVALTLVHDVLAGVAALHAAGLIHRDLNPRNVMVGREGRARIIDLGIVKRPGLGESTVDGLKGTLAYMAPEQLVGGEVSPATDLYAAGLMAYELLTGMSVAPARASVAELTTLRSQVPQPPSVFGAPADLDEPVVRALSPQMDARWQSAEAFRSGLGVGAEATVVREPIAELVEAAAGARRPLELPLGSGTQLATSPAGDHTEVAAAAEEAATGSGNQSRLLVVALVVGLVLGGGLLGWLVGKSDEPAPQVVTPSAEGGRGDGRRPGRRRGPRRSVEGVTFEVEVSSLGGTLWTLETEGVGRQTTPATLKARAMRPTVVRVRDGGDKVVGVLRLRRQGRRLLVSGRRGLKCGRKRVVLTPGATVECAVKGKPALKIRRP